MIFGEWGKDGNKLERRQTCRRQQKHTNNGSAEVFAYPDNKTNKKMHALTQEKTNYLTWFGKPYLYP